jgi:ABC-type multidrug transport system ATPase subunit
MPAFAPSTIGPLVLDGIARRFGRRSVLTAVSARFDPGTVVTVHGGNGSGKTSLLRIVAGVLAADRGSITFDASGGRHAVGFVPAGDRMLHWRLRGSHNLEFLAGLAGIDRQAARAHAAAAAEMLGATDLLDRVVGECSTGQRRRLMLAAGFVAAPPVVLLDEPLADLDGEGRAGVASLVRSWADRGGLVICAAPEVGEAPSADRTFELVGGALHPSGTSP